MDRLEELRLLVEIADSGSLAAGGRRTGRSPAAVSRTLNGLEARLGARLIERSTRASRLTEAGRRLVNHARKVLADYEDALSEVSGEATVATGRLRISAPLVFGRLHLAPIIGDFLADHPAMQIDLVLSNAVLNLRESCIDVALRIGHLADSTLVAKPVGQIRQRVVASPAYLARYGTPHTPADLANHAAILHAHADGVREWAFLHPEGRVQRLHPSCRWTVNQSETLIDAALAGRGLIRVPSYQVVDHLETGRLHVLLGAYEMAATPVHLVFASARFLPLRLRCFLDFATQALRASAAFREPVLSSSTTDPHRQPVDRVGTTAQAR